MRTYLVQRAKPRAFRVANRGIEGVETRMVGRDAELDPLQDAFERDARGRRKLGRASRVVGRGRPGQEPAALRVRALGRGCARKRFVVLPRPRPAATGAQPYGLLRDLLAWRFQIADSDSQAAARPSSSQASRRCSATTAPRRRHAHLLGHLIGLDFGHSPHMPASRDDAQQIRNRAFHAAAQTSALLHQSDGLAVVLLLDDLHWADDGSLDFINHLLQASRDVPLLVLCLTRPDPVRAARRLGAAPRAIHERIDLAPLDKRGSRELADELLQRLDPVPRRCATCSPAAPKATRSTWKNCSKMLIDEARSYAPPTPERWQWCPTSC